MSALLVDVLNFKMNHCIYIFFVQVSQFKNKVMRNWKVMDLYEMGGGKNLDGLEERKPWSVSIYFLENYPFSVNIEGKIKNNFQ